MAEDNRNRAAYLRLMYEGLDSKVNSYAGNINAVGDTSFDTAQLQMLRTNQAFDQAQRDVASSEQRPQDQANWWERTTQTISALRDNLITGFLGFFDGFYDWGNQALAGMGIISQEQADANANFDWQAYVTKYSQTMWSSPYAMFDPRVYSELGELWNDMQSGDTTRARAAADYTQQMSWASDWGGTGQFIRGVEQSIGQMLPSIVVGGFFPNGTIAQQAAALGTEGVGVFARSASENYAEHGDWGKANLQGLLSGVVETITEIFGGKILNKMTGMTSHVGGVFTQTIGTKAAKSINDAIPKSFIKQMAHSFAEEGFEEVLSGLVDPLIASIGDNGQSLSKYGDKDFWFGTNLDSILMQGLAGGVSGVVMGAPTTAMRIKQYSAYGEPTMQAREEFMKARDEYLADRTNEEKADKLAQASLTYAAYLKALNENATPEQIRNVTAGFTSARAYLNQNVNATLTDYAEQFAKDTESEKIKAGDMDAILERDALRDWVGDANAEMNIVQKNDESLKNSKGGFDQANVSFNEDGTLKALNISENLMKSGDFAAVLGHEVGIHLLLENASKADLSKYYNRIKNTGFWNNAPKGWDYNGKQLYDEYLKRYQQEGKADAEAKAKGEVVANYFEAMLRSENESKSFSKLNDLLMKESFFNTVKNALARRSFNMDRRITAQLAKDIRKAADAYNDVMAKRYARVYDKIVVEGKDEKQLTAAERLVYRELQRALASIDKGAQSEVDADGNDLSKGQIKFFKDSKIRDDEGNLIPLYHGSNSAGFTSFFGDVIFLTDEFDRAASYTRSDRLVVTRKFKTADELIDWFYENEQEEMPSGGNSFDMGRLKDDGRAQEYLRDKIERIRRWGEQTDSEKTKEACAAMLKNYESLFSSDAYFVSEFYAEDEDLEFEFFENEETFLKEALKYIQTEQNVAAEYKTSKDYDDWGDEDEGYSPKAKTNNVYALYANIKNPLTINCRGRNFMGVPYKGGEFKTDEVAKMVKEEGKYDGVIFENIKDNGARDMFDDLGRGTVYVAFSSNQLKAMDNLNPTEDEDIRYSIDKKAAPKNKADEVKSKSNESEERDIRRVLEENRGQHEVLPARGGFGDGLHWSQVDSSRISKDAERIIRGELKRLGVDEQTQRLDVIKDSDGNEFIANAPHFTYDNLQRLFKTLPPETVQMLSVDHSFDDFKKAKLTLTSTNGKATLTVTEDGDIINVVKEPNGGIRNFASKALELAIANGGVKMDCYCIPDPIANLPFLYSKSGFIPVSGIPYNADFINPAIREGFTARNNGKPIIFMKYTGEAKPVFSNYDECQKFIDEKVKIYDEWDDASNARDAADVTSKGKDVRNGYADLITEKYGEQLNEGSPLSEASDDVLKALDEQIAGEYNIEAQLDDFYEADVTRAKNGSPLSRYDSTLPDYKGDYPLTSTILAGVVFENNDIADYDDPDSGAYFAYKKMQDKYAPILTEMLNDMRNGLDDAQGERIPASEFARAYSTYRFVTSDKWQEFIGYAESAYDEKFGNMDEWYDELRDNAESFASSFDDYISSLGESEMSAEEQALGDAKNKDAEAIAEIQKYLDGKKFFEDSANWRMKDSMSLSDWQKIKRMADGEVLSLEELMSMDAIKYAEEYIDKHPQLHNDVPGTDGYIEDAEWKRLVKGVEKEFSDSYLTNKDKPVAKERKALILTGIPAAGKSTANDWIRKHKAVEFDNDVMKKADVISDYYDDGLGANTVQRIVSEAQDNLVKKVTKEGYNVFLPSVGKTKSSLLATMAALKRAGYTIEFENIILDKETAVNRAAKRFCQEGRYVPLDYIFDKVENKPVEVYNELAQEFEQKGYVKNGRERIKFARIEQHDNRAEDRKSPQNRGSEKNGGQFDRNHQESEQRPTEDGGGRRTPERADDARHHVPDNRSNQINKDNSRKNKGVKTANPLIAVEDDMAAAIKAAANDRLDPDAVVIAANEAAEALNELEGYIRETTKTEYSIPDSPTKARRLFEDLNVLQGDKQAIAEKFVRSIVEDNRSNGGTLFDEFAKSKSMTVEQYNAKKESLVEEYTSQLLKAIALKGKETKANKVVASLLLQLRSYSKSGALSNSIRSAMNAISKEVFKSGNTGQYHISESKHSLVDSFLKVFRTKVNGAAYSNSNMARFADFNMKGLVDYLAKDALDLDTDFVVEGSDGSLVNGRDLILELTDSLKSSYDPKAEIMTAEQEETAATIVRLVKRLYMEAKGSEMVKAKAQAKIIQDRIAEVNKRRKFSKTKIGRWFTRLVLDYTSPDVFFSYLFGGRDNAAYKLVWDDLMVKPYYAQLTKQRQYYTEFDALAKAVAKHGYDRIEVKNENGQTIKIEKNALYSFALNQMSPDNNVRLSNPKTKISYTEKGFAKVTHELSYATLDEAVKQNVNEEEMKELKAIFDWYNGSMQKYAKSVMEKNIGFSSLREGYYPIVASEAHRNTNFTEGDALGGIGANVLMNNRMKGLTNRMTNIEINVNPLFLGHNYIDKMTSSGEIGKASVLYNRLFRIKNEGKSAIVLASNGMVPNAKDYIGYAFNALIGNRQANAPDASFLSKLASRFATVQLGLNIRSSFKQTCSLFTAVQQVGMKAWFRGLMRNTGFKNFFSKARANAIASENPVFWNRTYNAGFSRAITLASPGQFTHGVSKRIADFSMKFVEGMDRFVCYTTYGMAEEYAKLQGLKEGTQEYKDMVNETFSQIIMNTQSNSDRIMMSRTRSGALGNIVKVLFGTFQSDAQNKASLCAKAILDYQSAKADGNNALLAKSKKSIGVFAAGVVASGLLAMLIDRLVDLIQDKKEWQELGITGDNWHKVLFEGFENTMLQWIPFVGTISDWFQYGSVSYLPLEPLDNLAEVASGFFDGQPISKAKMMKFIKAATDVFGLPATNFEKLVNGVIQDIPYAKLQFRNLLYGVSEGYLSNEVSNRIAKRNYDRAGEANALLYSLYKAPVSDAFAREVVRLKTAGASPSTRNIPSAIGDTALTDEQKAAFKEAYYGLGESASRLMASKFYVGLSDEQKASAITKLSSAYFDYASAKALGKEPSNRLAMLLAEGISIDEFIAIISSVPKDAKKDDVIKALNAIKGKSGNERILIAWLMGYQPADKSRLRNALVSAGVSAKSAKAATE